MDQLKRIAQKRFFDVAHLNIDGEPVTVVGHTQAVQRLRTLLEMYLAAGVDEYLNQTERIEP